MKKVSLPALPLPLLNKLGKKLMNTTAITAAGILAFSTNAYAANDWTDHVVVGGGGSITIDGTSKAKTTKIVQTGARVKVNGDGDIKSGWTVNLKQDSRTSQYILFDTELDPTYINGNLNANGQVFIFDQNGVIFGAASKVNVGSIVASAGTLTSTDTDLDAGKIKITSSATDGAVINRGKITVAEAGLAGLVSPNLLNSGVINAKLGTIAMASGETVTLDLYGDDLVNFAVGGELANGLIENTGTINAEGGNILVSAAIMKDAIDDVINLAGVTKATSAEVKGGKIVLSGGTSGRVNVRGSVNSIGKDQQDAGSIDITGERVRIADTAKVQVNSQNQAAGDINLIADKTLIMDGNISARGLTDTGFIETSAPITLFGSGASILATREWLLDPTDIDIEAASTLEGLIESQLATGDMVVETPAAGTEDGNINLNTVIDWATNNLFKLNADGNVNINSAGGINATGAGNFEAMAKNDIEVKGDITTQGGNVVLTAGVDRNQDDVNVDADIKTNGGNFEATAGDDVHIRADLFTGGGDVTLTTLDNINVSNVSVTSAGKIETEGGNVNINSDDIGISAINGTRIDAGLGDVNINRVSEGTIGLGDAAGDTSLIAGELAAMTAANLNIGNNLATAINVEGVDTSSNFSGLVNLNAGGTNGGVNFAGENIFNTITAEANDDILLANGGSITTLTGGVDLLANNNVSDGVTVLQIEGLIDTTAAGAAGTVDLEANGYFVEIDPSGSVVTDGGKLTVTSDHGFDVDKGATINLDNGGAHIDAPLVQLGDDINTTGTITGTASTVKVENDNAQIQDGVDVALENAAIDVSKGTYNEDVIIAKNGLTISGANAGTKGNDAARAEESIVTATQAGFKVTSHDVKIDGFAVDGAGNNGANGIEADGVNNFIATNNVLINNTDISGRPASGYTTGVGVLVNNATGNIDVTCNLAEGNTDGIRVLNSDAATLGDINVANNDVVGNADKGIIIKDSDNIKVTSNTLDNNKTGIWLEASSNGEVFDNDVQNSKETAIRLRTGSNENIILSNQIDGSLGNGILTEGSANLGINDNEIKNITKDGIALNNANNSVIESNRIDDVVNAAISSQNSNDIEITKNEINDNGAKTFANYGVLVEGGSSVDVTFNKIEETNIAGISATDTSFANIDDNIIKDGADGIYVSNGTNADIRRNTINDMSDDGIQALNHANIDVETNTLTNIADSGISVSEASNAKIDDNDINGATNGVRVTNNNNAIISNNEIDDASNAGIYVKDSDNAEITKNEINDNGASTFANYGVLVEGGDSVDITFNKIEETNVAGISATDTSFANIDDNIIKDGFDGIYISGGTNADIRRNTISDMSDDGIHALSHAVLEIKDNNKVTNVKDNGITVLSSAGAVVDGNDIDIARNGVRIDQSANSVVTNNTVDDATDDGIFVKNSNNTDVLLNQINDNGASTLTTNGIRITGSRNVDVTSNKIEETSLAGISAIRTILIKIKDNLIKDGNKGIDLTAGRNADIENNIVQNMDVHGIAARNHNNLDIKGNDISESGLNGIKVDNANTANIDSNIVDVSGKHGIQIAGNANTIINKNIVSNSAESGLMLAEGKNGTLSLTENSFTDNVTGATFMSGAIDLTGEGNFFTGGDTALRFATYIDKTPVSLSLVDNTLGTQTFEGQTDSYVELENGALFAPGTPTILNALDSIYVGTPFGKVTPSVDFANGFNVAQLAYFEDNFLHFTDNGNTGLFFFPPLPTIAQEDIFRFFGPTTNSLAGLNVTLLGLPAIPGGAPAATNFNNIAPAAGGETSPEALNAIATAAGGDESAEGGAAVSCWDDAVNNASTGQISSLSYGGGAQDLLNSEARCGS